MSRAGWVAMCGALWIAASFAVPTAWIEEWYSRGLYPRINHLLAPMFGASSVTWTGIAIIGAVALLIIRAVRRGIRRRRDGKGRTTRALLQLRDALLVGIFVYAWFLLTWGLGYRREPIEQRLDLGAAPVTTAELSDLTDRMVALAVTDSPREDERDIDRALSSIRAAMREVVRRWDGWEPALTNPKRPPAGLMLATGTLGAISPWLLEAHVDGALPPTSAISVAGHELAHVAGYCGEADADLLGFAAGLEADDRFARYATVIGILRHLRRGLSDERWRDVLSRLPPRAQADIDEVARAVKAHRWERLSSMRATVYDSYLRSQGVEAGLRDYDRGVGLLLRATRRGRVQIP